MHIDFELTSILFRGSIFVFFVYSLYRLFIKQRLKQYLDDSLAQACNEQVEFVEKDTLLLSTRKRLETQLNSQRQQFAALEKKYAAFIAAESKRIDAEALFLHNRAGEIIKKRELQQENLVKILALRGSIPEIIQTAQAELSVHYKDAGQGKRKIEDYLKKLA